MSADTTSGEYRTRIPPGAGPGSGARRLQATTDEVLSATEHEQRIEFLHAMCADLGLCRLLSSYNTSGIWTWNTHGQDWIYQVRPS